MSLLSVLYKLLPFVVFVLQQGVMAIADCCNKSINQSVNHMVIIQNVRFDFSLSDVNKVGVAFTPDLNQKIFLCVTHTIAATNISTTAIKIH